MGDGYRARPPSRTLFPVRRLAGTLLLRLRGIPLGVEPGRLRARLVAWLILSTRVLRHALVRRMSVARLRIRGGGAVAFGDIGFLHDGPPELSDRTSNDNADTQAGGSRDGTRKCCAC